MSGMTHTQLKKNVLTTWDVISQSLAFLGPVMSMAFLTAYIAISAGAATPLAVFLGGLTMVAVFLLHGANFLTLRLEGELHERAHQAAKKAYIGAAVMVVVLGISTYFYTDILTKFGINPGIIPIASAVVLLVDIFFINRRMEGWAFAFTGIHLVLTQIAFFMLMFPRVMISSTNPAWSLTIYNSSSSAYTLSVMSIVALIFVPIVLVYQGWTYYMFRKRVTGQRESLVY